MMGPASYSRMPDANASLEPFLVVETEIAQKRTPFHYRLVLPFQVSLRDLYNFVTSQNTKR